MEIIILMIVIIVSFVIINTLLLMAVRRILDWYHKRRWDNIYEVWKKGRIDE